MPGYARRHRSAMTKALALDLKRIRAQAFDRADWAEQAVRHYHAVTAKLDALTVKTLRGIYEWMFVPTTLWPFNIQDVLEDCLSVLEKGKQLNNRHQLIIELLPEPPDAAVCAAVTGHEFHVQKGSYENLVKTQAKYDQNELAIRDDPQLRRQWENIKAAFDVQAYGDHKGVIRRTMTAERNLRPSFSVNLRRPEEAFQAAFDAFCLRWNLYGMQHDEPLLLKLAVNLTPYGTMIHIPAYWSFDPSVTSSGMPLPNCIAPASTDARVPPWPKALPNGCKTPKNSASLIEEVRRLSLKGEKKHEFICRGLGWDVRTSSKRISRLRTEFKE